MADVFLRFDAKKRIYPPKALQEEFDFQAPSLHADNRKDALIIYKHAQSDGFGDLIRLGEKLKALKGKTPLQLKREGQKAMVKSMGA